MSSEFQLEFGDHRGGEHASLSPHAVGQYMVRAVPVARSHETAGTVRARLAGQKFDDAAHVFVTTDDGVLSGIASLTSLIGAHAELPMGQLMIPASGHVVTADTDREDAASLAIRREAGALAVTTRDGRLIGAIPATALMSILRDEHLEDLHHMAGILGKSEAAQKALSASPLRRAIFRLPWILIGLAGSALFTTIMTRFEAPLSAHIAVAFFVPALVYLTDSIGTQAETVVIRTLSLTGAPLTPLFAAEFATSLILGFVLSSLALPLVWLSFGNSMLALAVAISLFFATAVATGLGVLLPWTFDRLGFDPALSSGPIATVFQDASTLIIYLATAATLLAS
ncbi:magnesium transporter [Taklimakanibacter deserti]|uniref:magnesium transporter n=1 Tax=Taklimakanibacter deserti TaxID=2267839 RepID=UPI000E654AE3